MRVGALVKPAKRGGCPWRLGVVEEVLDDGRCKARAYVAPTGAYEGSAAVYRADELAEVPRATVEAHLLVTRAEAERHLVLARQIEAALAAADRRE